MAIEYNFTLDMDRSKRDNNIAYARTGDIDSITINADLVLNGAAYTPYGTNAFFECVTTNGHSVRASAEKTGSYVSVEVPSAAFQAAGVINVAYFRFESGASDNPTYVESTEPFAIVVREGIGDNIDAGDYIEEWRKLADQLEVAVAEVEKKAEQAETAINEQKTEVDQLKAQAQVSIAGDVTEVEGAAQSAIAAINKEKADVADAAEDISAAGEQAINSFNYKGTSAIDKFNIDGTSAINQFNTNAGSKLDEVDGMITEAQGDVDAAITQLETATGKAVSAMEDALDGTTAGSLQDAINRTLKLDVADMTNIPDNSSLSSFTNVGSYCCKTTATAATVGDCPIDDSPFNMYVFSSATSGQVMQLVVPIDLNGKPTAEWHVRFGTSSAMDKWSVIGGGADIAAGLGIDVTGDAQKTVSLDTDAFYQHHEAAEVIHGSTEVTGGGRIKELTVFGNTRQNLWVNPSGTSNGVTVTANVDGSITVSGTATADAVFYTGLRYVLKRNAQYAFSADNIPSGMTCNIDESSSSGYLKTNQINSSSTSKSFTTSPQLASALMYIRISDGATVSGTYHVMLNEGSEADQWCPPGLNGVDELSVVCAGKNLYKPFTQGKVTANDDGSMTVLVSTTTWENGPINDLHLPAGTQIVLSTDHVYAERVGFGVFFYDSAGRAEECNLYNKMENTITLSRDCVSYVCFFNGETAAKVTSHVQLEFGKAATTYEPYSATTTPVNLNGHALNSLPDGTRDELTIDATGAVTLVQRVGVFKATDGTLWAEYASVGNINTYYTSTGMKKHSHTGDDANAVDTRMMCDDFQCYQVVLDIPVATPSIGMSDNALFADSMFYNTAGYGPAASDTRMTVLYPLAAPQEVDLPDVTLPELASTDYTFFATSSVPAEIEAEVVKVDYLPAPDVYTKEEVDRKIDDAGMPAVVPVSKGGTGVTTAAAERNRLGLGNTTGALPVANGGTGKTTAKAAQNALLVNIEAVSTDVIDGSFFAGYYQSPSDVTGALYKRSASTVWNWIVSKIRSTFGFSSSNVLPVSNGGTGLTKAPSMLVNLESASADNPLASDPRPGVSGELPLTRGGTGGTSAVAARTNLGVYSKAEVDGKVPKVVYGTGNIPSNAENGTIYIQYRS